MSKRPKDAGDHQESNKRVRHRDPASTGIPPTTIEELDDESLGSILGFLPGQFRFVAGTNRRFRRLYPHAAKTFHAVAMESYKTRAMWFQENEYQVRQKGCQLAANVGNLDALKWLRSRDCSWSQFREHGGDEMVTAASRGHTGVLQFVIDQTAPWGTVTIISAYNGAACNGHVRALAILEAHTESDNRWFKGICAGAAGNGHLKVLQRLLLRSSPSTWGELTCLQAVRGGHLPVLQWLRSQNPPCPWHAQSCLVFAQEGSEMKQFIRSQI